MSEERPLWLVIPTATRRQYIPDIIVESGIERNHIVIVHTLSLIHI